MAGRGSSSRPGEAADAGLYRSELGPFVAELGAAKQLRAIIAFDLECRKVRWHRVQAVQRLFNWGVAVGLAKVNPFAGVKRPSRGQRYRILERPELVRLLRSARRPLRDVLMGQRYLLARPQEARQLDWEQYPAGPGRVRARRVQGEGSAD